MSIRSARLPVPEPEPFPEPQPAAAEILPGSEVVEPTYDDRLVAAPRPAEPVRLSAAELTQVALTDPDRYMELKSQGQSLPKLGDPSQSRPLPDKLEKLSWRPDR